MEVGDVEMPISPNQVSPPFLRKIGKLQKCRFLPNWSFCIFVRFPRNVISPKPFHRGVKVRTRRFPQIGHFRIYILPFSRNAISANTGKWGNGEMAVFFQKAPISAFTHFTEGENPHLRSPPRHRHSPMDPLPNPLLNPCVILKY